MILQEFEGNELVPQAPPTPLWDNYLNKIEAYSPSKDGERGL